jgi:hypothetical protein
MVAIIMSAYDPQGKQHKKSLKSEHFSKKEIDEIILNFKRHIQSGLAKKDFKILKNPVVDREEKVVAEPPKLKQFETMHISDLETPENGCFSFACIGSTRSGKSYAINYIYEKFFKKHLCMLMTLSSHSDIYKGFKKSAVITDGFHEELIDEPMKIGKLTNNHYKFCLIFDDLCLDGKNGPAMTKLLTIGRNSGMSCIISGQKMTMLNATGRSNVNYVLCFRQNTESAIEDTIKTFLRSYFPKHLKISEMVSLYKEMTEDHHFFLVDCLNDKCFISKI